MTYLHTKKIKLVLRSTELLYNQMLRGINWLILTNTFHDTNVLKFTLGSSKVARA